MQFISDTWLSTFISILITVFVAFLIFRLQRKRKEITYEIISDTFVLNVDENMISKVQVMFGARKVNDARLVVIRIQNSGDEPIVQTDYTEPIKCIFDRRAEILEAQILETKPNNMKASGNCSGQQRLAKRGQTR